MYKICAYFKLQKNTFTHSIVAFLFFNIMVSCNSTPAHIILGYSCPTSLTNGGNINTHKTLLFQIIPFFFIPVSIVDWNVSSQKNGIEYDTIVFMDENINIILISISQCTLLFSLNNGKFCINKLFELQLI